MKALSCQQNSDLRDLPSHMQSANRSPLGQPGRSRSCGCHHACHAPSRVNATCEVLQYPGSTVLRLDRQRWPPPSTADLLPTRACGWRARRSWWRRPALIQYAAVPQGVKRRAPRLNGASQLMTLSRALRVTESNAGCATRGPRGPGAPPGDPEQRSCGRYNCAPPMSRETIKRRELRLQPPDPVAAACIRR